MSTQKDWERLANEAIADAQEWKRRATKAENLIRQIAPAVETADCIATRHRLAGTDQNPKGWRDLIGSACLTIERWRKS